LGEYDGQLFIVSQSFCGVSDFARAFARITATVHRNFVISLFFLLLFQPSLVNLSGRPFHNLGAYDGQLFIVSQTFCRFSDFSRAFTRITSTVHRHFLLFQPSLVNLSDRAFHNLGRYDAQVIEK